MFRFLIPLLLSAGFISSVKKPSPIPSAIIKHSISADYMLCVEKGEKGCDPISIARSSVNDSIYIVFPRGGTQSTLYLYQADSWMKDMQRTEKKTGPLQKNEVFAGEKKELGISLTGYPDGHYLVHMTSCHLGGFVNIHLHTGKPVILPAQPAAAPAR